MPHIYIDGKKIETNLGKTVIEAATENGIDIPHFCWHPELSVSGNCRMCLIEMGLPKRSPDGSFEKDENDMPVIGFFPKLQIACATQISDGMHIKTSSEKVIDAREAVMEFILINHPLDCPICDEAGQCKLQDYTMKHSNSRSRFVEEKNHGKKRQQWGPYVMYDAERCIACSRCIRIAKEVADQDVLTFVNRGDKVTIELFEDTVFDNPYSMNVIDNCPVGALTSSDFRFKSRVWDMSFRDSISPFDATGTNIKIGVKNNKILRIEPRTNKYVNKHWMLDEARLNYQFVNDNRVSQPQIKKDGKKDTIEWKDVYDEVSKKFKQYKPNEILIIASAKASNEDSYVLKRFADQLNIKNIAFLAHNNEKYADKVIGSADLTPNSTGARLFGLTDKNDVTNLMKSNKIKMLYVMEEDFQDHAHLFDCIKNIEYVVTHAYNNSKLTELADIVLPAATFAEIEGTYVNNKNRVQYLAPVLLTKDNHKISIGKMSRLDKMGAPNDRWSFQETIDCKQSWKIIQSISNRLGFNFNYSDSEDVFEDIVQSHKAFEGMDYETLEQQQGIILKR